MIHRNFIYINDDGDADICYCQIKYPYFDGIYTIAPSYGYLKFFESTLLGAVNTSLNNVALKNDELGGFNIIEIQILIKSSKFLLNTIYTVKKNEIGYYPEQLRGLI